LKNNQPSISIVVPCLNEEASLASLVQRIARIFRIHGISFEIIIVNDASTDSTLSVLEELAREVAELKFVTNPKTQGILASWLNGTRVSLGDSVGLIDADLQNVPEDLLRLFEVKNISQTSVVQGFRSSIERTVDIRLIYSRSLNFMLNLCFNDTARDNKSGFLIADRFLLMRALEILQECKFFYPHTFIRIVMRKLGAQVIEIETLFQPRVTGESFIKGSKSINAAIKSTFYDIPKAMFMFRFKKFTNSQFLLPKNFSFSDDKFIDETEGLNVPRRFLRFLYFATMPVHKWIIRGTSKKIYFDLKKTQFLPRAKIEELQLMRLKNLVNHVYLNVPYYKRIMKEQNLRPQDFVTLTDLQKFPLLSKNDVRNHTYFDLFSNSHEKKRMLKVRTSGSTGEPFVVYADKFQLEVRFATTLRQIEWTGWRFGDKQIRLWHQKIGMTFSQSIRERIDALILRRSFIPAFEISPVTLNVFIDKIRKAKPVLIDGYAESLNFLATYLIQNRIEGLKPKAVMSSAQILPQKTRELIEFSLNTKVYDKYGSREFSGIAYECSESSGLHHVMDESYVVEILVDGRPAKEGEVGEVVITDLNNFSFPLIRFRIGDLAMAVSQEICRCGRALKLIGEIQGRSQSIVLCADGKWMPGSLFLHFFKDYEHLVKHFQIVQQLAGEVILNFVPGNQFTLEDFNLMLSNLNGFLGRETKIQVVKVDSIPLLATGKRTPIISHLDLDFQQI
jgi:phenylacetate-CoA ligase